MEQSQSTIDKRPSEWEKKQNKGKMYLGFLERVMLFLSRVHHLGFLGLSLVHHVVHVQLLLKKVKKD